MAWNIHVYMICFQSFMFFQSNYSTLSSPVVEKKPFRAIAAMAVSITPENPSQQWKATQSVFPGDSWLSRANMEVFPEARLAPISILVYRSFMLQRTNSWVAKPPTHHPQSGCFRACWSPGCADALRRAFGQGTFSVMFCRAWGVAPIGNGMRGWISVCIDLYWLTEYMHIIYSN